MSFLSPLRLLLLALPLAVGVTYLILQSRRSRYSLRLATVETLASVAPKRPGWRRHLPALGVLAALVLSTLAFARPARAEQVPVERGTVILALDTSYSMAAEDVAPTRLDAALDALDRFLDDVPERVDVGLVTFDGSARLLAPPSDDRAALRAQLDQLELAPRTATGEAIFTSLDALGAAAPDDTTGAADGDGRYIVLLADGGTTVGRSNEEAAQAAADAGVPISTIAFGTAEGTVEIDGETYAAPADPASLQEVADTTGGQAYTAETADELQDVYAEIGTRVATEERTVEMTAWFSAGALLTAGFAAFAGLLIWGNRLL